MAERAQLPGPGSTQGRPIYSEDGMRPTDWSDDSDAQDGSRDERPPRRRARQHHLHARPQSAFPGDRASNHPASFRPGAVAVPYRKHVPNPFTPATDGYGNPQPQSRPYFSGPDPSPFTPHYQPVGGPFAPQQTLYPEPHHPGSSYHHEPPYGGSYPHHHYPHPPADQYSDPYATDPYQHRVAPSLEQRFYDRRHRAPQATIPPDNERYAVEDLQRDLESVKLRQKEQDESEYNRRRAERKARDKLRQQVRDLQEEVQRERHGNRTFRTTEPSRLQASPRDLLEYLQLRQRRTSDADDLLQQLVALADTRRRSLDHEQFMRLGGLSGLDRAPTRDSFGGSSVSRAQIEEVVMDLLERMSRTDDDPPPLPLPPAFEGDDRTTVNSGRARVPSEYGRGPLSMASEAPLQRSQSYRATQSAGTRTHVPSRWVRGSDPGSEYYPPAAHRRTAPPTQDFLKMKPGSMRPAMKSSRSAPTPSQAPKYARPRFDLARNTRAEVDPPGRRSRHATFNEDAVEGYDTEDEERERERLEPYPTREKNLYVLSHGKLRKLQRADEDPAPPAVPDVPTPAPEASGAAQGRRRGKRLQAHVEDGPIEEEEEEEEEPSQALKQHKASSGARRARAGDGHTF